MDHELTRREFLEVSAAAGVAAFAAPVVPRELTMHERQTLLAAGRTLFEHPAASDEIYERVVTNIAARSQADCTLFSALNTAIQHLDRSAGGDFATSRATMRVRCLKSIKGSDCFRILYQELAQGIYGSPDAWKLFGRHEQT